MSSVSMGHPEDRGAMREEAGSANFMEDKADVPYATTRKGFSRNDFSELEKK